MRRLFLAFNLPDEWQQRLDAYPHSLLDMRWVPRENRHITLAFLGQVTEERQAALVQDIHHLFWQAPALSGGHLSLWHQCILVAQLELTPQLAALHQQLRRLLDQHGWPPEPKPYQPHITLARRNRPLLGGKWRRYQERFSAPVLNDYQPSQCFLYASELHPEGARYQRLVSFAAAK